MGLYEKILYKLEPILTILTPILYILIILACLKFLCGCSFMGGMEMPSGSGR